MPPAQQRQIFVSAVGLPMTNTISSWRTRGEEVEATAGLSVAHAAGRLMAVTTYFDAPEDINRIIPAATTNHVERLVATPGSDIDVSELVDLFAANRSFDSWNPQRWWTLDGEWATGYRLMTASNSWIEVALGTRDAIVIDALNVHIDDGHRIRRTSQHVLSSPR